jgi:hypothetical protein
LVCIKDRHGKICYHYGDPVAGRMFGSCIPWLSDEQAAHLLRCQTVERIDDDAPGEHADRAELDDRVSECVAALNGLDLPPDAGGVRSREALRQAGQRFGNNTIAEAVRLRRNQADLSGTV